MLCMKMPDLPEMPDLPDLQDRCSTRKNICKMEGRTGEEKSGA